LLPARRLGDRMNRRETVLALLAPVAEAAASECWADHRPALVAAVGTGHE